MMKFKVFRQIADATFVEIANATYLEDAEAVLNRWHSGMVTRDGAIITTKNLISTDTPQLFTN